MKLSVFERLMLLSILPREGDFTTLKIIKDLRDSLSFTELEHRKYQFKKDDNSIRWKTDIEQNKEIKIGEKATDIIVESLKKLNKQKKLTMQHYSLCEKFKID